MQKVLDILKQYKHDLLDETHGHVCNRKYCNPQNHEQLVFLGLCPPHLRPDTSIYLCKYRQYHVCDYEHCHCDVCPISGACYGTGGFSSYDYNDPRTRQSRPDVDDQLNLHVLSGSIIHPIFDDDDDSDEPATKRSKITMVASEVRKRIEGHVETLLYGKERKKINSDFMSQHEKACTREKDIYIGKCRLDQVPPNQIALHMINDRYKRVQMPLVILDMDQSILTYYTNVVMQIYELVQRYSSDNGQGKVCIASVTLGVLYLMRTSYQIDGITLIPLDRFMQENLPSMNELPRFGFDKKRYTRGSKLITFSYGLALKKGVDIRKLCLDFSTISESATQVQLFPLNAKKRA